MTSSPDGILRIASVTRTVSDIEAAALFYRNALDFSTNRRPSELSSAECAFLGVEPGLVLVQPISLGRQHVTLLQFTPSGQTYPAGSTSTDLWFQHCAIVVGDMQSAYAQVTGAGAVPISDGPQHLPANTGAVTAFKFRDPFGHPLELLSLPDGVGDPAWHHAKSGLFLGIDHTAIAVSASEASSRFYTEVVGLAVEQRTRNRGAAQTRLDAVPADDVDVTALAPSEAPPHLELLAYRTGTRRPLTAATPADAAVSRTIAAGHVDRVADRLARAGHAARRGTWDGRPAISFGDPDGHAWICHSV